jgi:hypothetical protein
LSYNLTSRLFARRKLMTRKSTPRGVTTAACRNAVEGRHHAQARLAVIAAGVHHNHRRVPIEVSHPLE